MNVAPFPYGQLPVRQRHSTAPRLELLRALPLDAGKHFSEASEALLGAPLQVSAGEARELIDPLVIFAFEHPRGGRAVFAIDPSMASALFDRLLGGVGADAAPLTSPPSALERGALLYAATRLLPPSTEWLARDILANVSEAARFVGTAPQVAGGGLRLGDRRGLWRAARSWVGTTHPEAGPWARMLEIPMTLEAAWGHLRASEVGGLSVGDVLVLEETGLTAVGPLDGWVRLRGCGSRRGSWRCRVDGPDLRVQAAPDTPGAVFYRPASARGRGRISGGTPMSQSEDEGAGAAQSESLAAALGAVGDVELELSLELARFTMPIGEVAAFRPGQVVGTGRALGSEVTLWAQGKAIARGELVAVDGEVGVELRALSAPPAHVPADSEDQG